MKTFSAPVVDVKRFDLVDVLTTSETEPETPTTEMPAFMGDLCVSA